MKDAQHPFFRPLWRRVAVVATCVVWAGVEFAVGDPMFGVMTGAIGAYGAWVFLLNYKPAAPDEGPATTPGE
ncbi:DUF3329 domain-containing protein [Aureimonas sp. ME7]|uniref:DUF3329 domain-containing protein n=1 Tax=Aureimonas sp. ME7 TaxID=2744252 RepID=UPI0015F72A4B|nr:DUF3329 domain-containing protein [Aureimonas sp. ME7]